MRLPLRRYAIRERVGVKIGVVTQTRPWAVLLCCVCDAVFLTFGKVVPRIVASDGQKRPVGTLQVLHQHIARSSVIGSVRQFTEHLLQLLSMTRSRAIIRDRVN